MKKKAEKSQNVTAAEVQDQPQEVVDNIRFTCFEVANQYIQDLDDPESIYQNNGLFVDMLKYIYKSYLGDIIGNNKDNSYNFRYNYNLLDKIFYIYTSLVYKYKQNKRPSIIEFSLFVNINRQSIYNVVMGYTKNVTPEVVDKVKKWYTECENQLTNGSSVFEIFLLKSQYRYNDNSSPIPVESQGGILSAGELPDLQQLKIAKNDIKQDQ